jgi:hypothetical protein
MIERKREAVEYKETARYKSKLTMREGERGGKR